MLLLQLSEPGKPSFPWVKKAVDNTWWRVLSNAGCRRGLERTADFRMVGSGDLTAWPDAPYCSQGEEDRRGPEVRRTIVLTDLKRWDCAEGVHEQSWGQGGHSAPALSRHLLKTIGPLGSHMWITSFLLLFLFIVLPCDTLAASHLFIHSQSLSPDLTRPEATVLASRLMARLFFHGLHPFSWAPLTVLNTLLGTGIWLMFSS